MRNLFDLVEREIAGLVEFFMIKARFAKRVAPRGNKKYYRSELFESLRARNQIDELFGFIGQLHCTVAMISSINFAG